MNSIHKSEFDSPLSRIARPTLNTNVISSFGNQNLQHDAIRTPMLSIKHKSSQFLNNNQADSNKESMMNLRERSKIGIEQFKLWELGIDEKQIVHGGDVITYVQPTLNQKLSKKWELKGNFQKKKEEEDEKNQFVYSKKLELGLQYHEDKQKQQVDTFGAFSASRVPPLITKKDLIIQNKQ